MIIQGQLCKIKLHSHCPPIGSVSTSSDAHIFLPIPHQFGNKMKKTSQYTPAYPSVQWIKQRPHFQRIVQCIFFLTFYGALQYFSGNPTLSSDYYGAVHVAPPLSNSSTSRHYKQSACPFLFAEAYVKNTHVSKLQTSLTQSSDDELQSPKGEAYGSDTQQNAKIDNEDGGDIASEDSDRLDQADGSISQPEIGNGNQDADTINSALSDDTLSGDSSNSSTDIDSENVRSGSRVQSREKGRHINFKLHHHAVLAEDGNQEDGNNDSSPENDDELDESIEKDEQEQESSEKQSNIYSDFTQAEADKNLQNNESETRQETSNSLIYQQTDETSNTLDEFDEGESHDQPIVETTPENDEEISTSQEATNDSKDETNRALNEADSEQLPAEGDFEEATEKEAADKQDAVGEAIFIQESDVTSEEATEEHEDHANESSLESEDNPTGSAGSSSEKSAESHKYKEDEPQRLEKKQGPTESQDNEDNLDTEDEGHNSLGSSDSEKGSFEQNTSEDTLEEVVNYPTIETTESSDEQESSDFTETNNSNNSGDTKQSKLNQQENEETGESDEKSSPEQYEEDMLSYDAGSSTEDEESESDTHSHSETLNSEAAKFIPQKRALMQTMDEEQDEELLDEEHYDSSDEESIGPEHSNLEDSPHDEEDLEDEFQAEEAFVDLKNSDSDTDHEEASTAYDENEESLNEEPYNDDEIPSSAFIGESVEPSKEGDASGGAPKLEDLAKEEEGCELQLAIQDLIESDKKYQPLNDFMGMLKKLAQKSEDKYNLCEFLTGNRKSTEGGSPIYPQNTNQLKIGQLSPSSSTLTQHLCLRSVKNKGKDMPCGGLKFEKEVEGFFQLKNCLSFLVFSDPLLSDYLGLHDNGKSGALNTIKKQFEKIVVDGGKINEKHQLDTELFYIYKSVVKLLDDLRNKATQAIKDIQSERIKEILREREERMLSVLCAAGEGAEANLKPYISYSGDNLIFRLNLVDIINAAQTAYTAGFKGYGQLITALNVDGGLIDRLKDIQKKFQTFRMKKIGPKLAETQEDDANVVVLNVQGIMKSLPNVQKRSARKQAQNSGENAPTAPKQASALEVQKKYNTSSYSHGKSFTEIEAINHNGNHSAHLTVKGNASLVESKQAVKSDNPNPPNAPYTPSFPASGPPATAPAPPQANPANAGLPSSAAPVAQGPPLQAPPPQAQPSQAQPPQAAPLPQAQNSSQNPQVIPPPRGTAGQPGGPSIPPSNLGGSSSGSQTLPIAPHQQTTQGSTASPTSSGGASTATSPSNGTKGGNSQQAKKNIKDTIQDIFLDLNIFKINGNDITGVPDDDLVRKIITSGFTDIKNVDWVVKLGLAPEAAIVAVLQLFFEQLPDPSQDLRDWYGVTLNDDGSIAEGVSQPKGKEMADYIIRFAKFMDSTYKQNKKDALFRMDPLARMAAGEESIKDANASPAGQAAAAPTPQPQPAEIPLSNLEANYSVNRVLNSSSHYSELQKSSGSFAELSDEYTSGPFTLVSDPSGASCPYLSQFASTTVASTEISKGISSGVLRSTGVATLFHVILLLIPVAYFMF